MNIKMNNSVFLVFCAFILFHSCGIKDDYKQISHQEFIKSHQYNIGQTTFNLNDDKRERPIKIEVWYPTKDTTRTNIRFAEKVFFHSHNVDNQNNKLITFVV